MPYVEHVQKIWDNDLSMPAFGMTSEEVWEFKRRTGATRVSFLEWICNGESRRCTYPAVVLPDKTGVVLLADVTAGAPMPSLRHKLKVIDADGCLRCFVVAPIIDCHSIPDKAWLNLPQPFLEFNLQFGVPASDGWRMIVMDIDWQTGKMVRWFLAPHIAR